MAGAVCLDKTAAWGKHPFSRTVGKFTFTSDNEDFSGCCDRSDRRFFIFFCLFFLLLQNVVELQKSLLVVDVVEKAQQPDIETK